MANATRICSINDCERSHNAHGWCLPHYKRWQKYGDPLGSPPARETICAVSGCGRERRARQWCSMHYQRWQEHGDAEHRAPVRLCSVEECHKKLFGKGWCIAHYTRWKRHGSPTFRVAGEIVDGRRICPGCRQDKLLADYSADTGRCKVCIAAQRRVSRLSKKTVALPAIHCIMCSESFVPMTSKNYCCSSICSARRKSELDLYRQRVDRNLESQRAWDRGNPDRRVQAQARRRARKVGTQIARFGRSEISARMAFFGNRCWMCGGAFECIDHVKPLSKGGPHLLSNLRPACNSCNGSKSNTWEGVAALRALAT